jgi:hypothetical protein
LADADRASNLLIWKSVADDAFGLAARGIHPRYVFVKMLKINDVQQKSAHEYEDKGS